MRLRQRVAGCNLYIARPEPVDGCVRPLRSPHKIPIIVSTPDSDACIRQAHARKGRHPYHICKMKISLKG
jgi:hypothetical protein